MNKFIRHTLSALTATTVVVVMVAPAAAVENDDKAAIEETTGQRAQQVVDVKTLGVADKIVNDDDVKELKEGVLPVVEETLPPQSKEALAMLKKYMDSTKTLTAEFSSILLDDTGEQTDASNGTVAFKVPGKFRWQYENPDPSILLADGVDLWHFDEVLEQVIVSSLDDYRGANPSLLLGGDSDKITEGFKVVGSHKTEGDQWIVLETRDRNSDFVTVRIKFNDDAIQLMELVDRVDQTSRISFSDVTLNADIDDALFTFEVPEGASLNGQPTKR